jgi:hypothetical protein
MSNEAMLIERLNALVASGDSASIEGLVFDFGMLVLEEGSFPQGCFDQILTVLSNDQFRRLESSWKMLRVFEYNWDDLSEQQRSALLVALEMAYKSFADWMACFVISGILGELYRDDRAFATLCRLKSESDEMPRSFIPHGFEHIVRDTSDPALAGRALAELKAMQMDLSERVVREVAESLGRLAKQHF